MPPNEAYIKGRNLHKYNFRSKGTARLLNEKSPMRNAHKLRLIIPSFNRGCQLECLLRSLYTLCKGAERFSICAFYRFSDEKYREGYEIVKRAFPEVEFVEQSLVRSFKEQILGLFGDEEFVGIIVDDMVILEGFDTDEIPFKLLAERDDIFSISLRLDNTKTFSQASNQGAMPPFCDENNIWRWMPKLSRRYRTTRFIDRYILKSAACDWSYPCALDGTIFRGKTFREFFESVEDFVNIPFLEKAMIKAAFTSSTYPPNMIRYPRAKAISLAMNSVDEYHDYPSFGLDAREFNDLFLTGERLDYEPFRKIIFHACHIACSPFWLSKPQNV